MRLNKNEYKKNLDIIEDMLQCARMEPEPAGNIRLIPTRFGTIWLVYTDLI